MEAPPHPSGGNNRSKSGSSPFFMLKYRAGRSISASVASSSAAVRRSAAGACALSLAEANAGNSPVMIISVISVFRISVINYVCSGCKGNSNIPKIKNPVPGSLSMPVSSSVGEPVEIHPVDAQCRIVSLDEHSHVNREIAYFSPFLNIALGEYISLPQTVIRT